MCLSAPEYVPYRGAGRHRKGEYEMTKAERIRAALRGERPDRVPYALWSHFPGIDMDPEKLAEESWSFYKKLDIDLIKTMNNGMYPIEDLGCEVDYSEIRKGGVAKLVSTPVHQVSDWDKIPVCDPGKGALARELHSLELLLEMRDKAGDDVPVIFTCFSPLTIADKVSGKHWQEHIDQGGISQIKAALDRITETTCALVRRATEMGADGIFFASQMSNYDVTTAERYRELGVPYDVQVIQSSRGWFNVLHAHGNDIMFELLKDYPVQVFNWHVGESLPEMDECALLTGKCLMGGLQRADITNRNHNAVHNQIFRALKATDGKGLILTPGCVIRYPLDEEMLASVRKTKEEVEGKLF